MKKPQSFRVLLLFLLSPLGADHIFNLKSTPIVSLTKDYNISKTRRRKPSIQ